MPEKNSTRSTFTTYTRLVRTVRNVAVTEMWKGDRVKIDRKSPGRSPKPLEIDHFIVVMYS